MIYTLQFGSGDTWHYGASFPKLIWAMAALRHCTRTEEFYTWRIVNDEGVQIVAITPGERGAA